ncbi:MULTISPECIES: helix-turn-helix transcriptional regulator [Brevundimonas]|uniref:helix-turn-helix domain-containing protein n=1 Tax=Brevundimonas TaxID=41275 RepID=UPI001ADC4E7E|nr:MULTISPECIES: helix-turn-helix transcriptional regulator [Brevundimonas]MBO9502653.1 helix-turn-helix transcriptional regulator [Brevundimonas sp. A19_0]
MRIVIRIDELMLRKKMSLNQLSEQVGISTTNLSLLKNGHVRGVRFNTLLAICQALDCRPGDILDIEEEA